MTLTVTETKDVATCLELRRIVFIEEQNVPEVEDVDGQDGSALHLIAQDGDIPLGAARILIKGKVAKIGRVCVLKSCRRHGTGQQIVRTALDVARQQPGVTHVRLGAQLQALGFYERLGFRAFGPVYDDAGIDHRDMELAL